MLLIAEYLRGCWEILAQMAPALLAGFLAAGLLSAFISESFIKKHLGGRGLAPVAKAALLGVPMPLCSCGVLPVAAALKRSGASRGAVVAFLISVPQTGADNILVVWSMLGLAFAIYSPISAFLSGLFGGALCERFGDERPDGAEEQVSLNLEKPERKPLPILKYAFTTLLDDIAGALLLGVAVAGLVSALIPDGWISSHIGGGIGSMLMMLLVGIPLYVCSSGSVPIAAAFMAKGASAGAALVFLITGPASNAAGIAAISKMLGFRTAVLYVMSLVIFAFGSGLLLNEIFAFLPQSAVQAPHHVHGEGLGLLNIVCGALLLALLAFSLCKGVFMKRIVEKEGLMRIHVEGMSCKHCSSSVENALKALPGVKTVSVDLKSGKAEVEPIEEGKAPSFAAVKEAVEKLGFKCDPS